MLFDPLRFLQAECSNRLVHEVGGQCRADGDDRTARRVFQRPAFASSRPLPPLGHLARDQDFLDLVGAVVNLEYTGVAVVLLDAVVCNEAGAALPRIIGISRALQLLFSADAIDAAEAYRIGLIDRLTEKGGALGEAQRMIDVYARRAPLSLAFTKRAVHRGLQMDLASGLELEVNMVSALYATEDKQEGISAFLGKREAKFSGR